MTAPALASIGPVVYAPMEIYMAHARRSGRLSDYI